MTPKYDSKFAGYATRIAFDIRLTRPQIFYLSLIGAGYRATSRNGQHWDRENSEIGRHIFVPQVKGLQERGLVEHQTNMRPGSHPDDWIYRLTEAGEHVYSLLKIAGLAVEFNIPANEEKPRHRVKAGRA